MPKRTNGKLGALTRGLIVLPALVVALSLAFTGAASAQTAFQASVNGINPKPKPPCAPTITSPPRAAVFCGSASIAGYGPVVWTLNATPTSPVISGCFNYSGTTTFELLGGGGTLVLDETGQACAPGNSGASSASANSFGHPTYATASWMVDPASTGQFEGVTRAGTDTLHAAGAQLMGTYTGTLVPPASS